MGNRIVSAAAQSVAWPDYTDNLNAPGPSGGILQSASSTCSQPSPFPSAISIIICSATPEDDTSGHCELCSLNLAAPVHVLFVIGGPYHMVVSHGTEVISAEISHS